MSKIKKEMLKTEIQHLKADAVFYWVDEDSPEAEDDEYEFKEGDAFLYLGHFSTPDGIWYMARPLGREPELLKWFDCYDSVHIVPWKPSSSLKNGAEYPARALASKLGK